MLKNYCEHVPAKFLPDFYETIKTKFGNDYEKYTKWLYSHSKLLKKGQKFYQNEKTLKDPGVMLGVGLLMNYRAILADLSNKTEEIDAEEKKLCEAKVQMEMDLPHYSDANFHHAPIVWTGGRIHDRRLQQQLLYNRREHC